MKYHPWLAPLYRRLAVLAVCACWVIFEVIVAQEEIWLWFAIGITAFGAWDFLLSGKYRAEPDAKAE